MKNKIILFFFLFSVVFCGRMVAYDDFYFRHYNNKDGLSHNTVFCSIQDKKGYMWFGTEEGLNRFNGYEFKVYKHYDSDPSTIPNSSIYFLFQDSRETIWVFSRGHTSLYDEKNDSFVPFVLPGDTEPAQYLYMREDKNGDLWFINRQEVLCYNPEQGSFRKYASDDHFIPVNITMPESGIPVFSDFGDLLFYQPEINSFHREPILTEQEKREFVSLSVICEVPGLGFLIGTTRAGVKLWTSHNRGLETIIEDIQVRAITHYYKDIYWIGTESGIYIFNALTRTVTQLTKSLTNEYALADNAVYCLTKDNEGGIWAGTFFGGISYLPRQLYNFRHYIAGKTHPGLLGNAIREICPDKYGNLWIGTEDNGINKYELRTDKFTNYSLKNPVNPLSATNIHGLLAEDDKLWIGTYNRGIDVMDIPTGKIIKKYTNQNTSGGLVSNFILCFLRTTRNEFLIGTGNGIVILDEANDQVKRWNNIHGMIRQIYEDRKRNIWAVTNEELFRYCPEEKRVFSYGSRDNSPGSLPSDNVTSVFEDSNGNIWVTTFRGFCLYNQEEDSFFPSVLTPDAGSEITYRMVEDQHGFLWITTANGLLRFNPADQSSQLFSFNEGLHEAQFNYSSSYISPDGTIYLGTINGMLSFDPKQFTTDEYIPPVYISNVRIPGNRENNNEQADRQPHEPESLRLPYNKSTFTVSYGAVCYTAPTAIRYAYKLEGMDHDWKVMDHIRDVTFAGIAPGNYTFKVRSTNSTGIWTDNIQEMKIAIIPPFWMTGWAYAFYFCCFCLMGFLFYQYKKRQLERRHAANREIFENMKEKELYDAKIQFFTFITHEIRTPLTLIKAPLEKIIRSGDGNDVTRDNLVIIEKNTQRLLNLSNQLLDFRRAESKAFKLNFIETDIPVWIESLLSRFRETITAAQKDFTVTLLPPGFYGFIDRDAMVKIISNLITNAIKYSDKYISLTLSPDDPDNGLFTIRVVNDGPLIPESEREEIFQPFYRVRNQEHKPGSGIGLSLARSLVEFHHGSLAYDYTPEGMNRFTLSFPVKQATGIQLSDIREEQETPTQTVRIQDPGKPVILLVEDQPDMRQFIARELSCHYTVIEAENGKKALERLSEQAVHLIISDVMMPVMDGFSFCNEVKNNIQYSHIPFIILTAQHNLQSRLTGLNNGADAYIEKPFSVELLTGQIRNLLANREKLSRHFIEKPHTEAVSLAISKMDELFLEKLNSFIEEQMSNDALNVEMLAGELNMSTSSLYRKVKGLSGISPVDYIKIARLKKAVILMGEGESRINEIAFKVGFSSPAYFSTCFQKQYGKSPSEFMKG